MKRRGALAGVILALAVTAAACGGGSGGGSGDNAAVSIKTLQAAVDNTQAAQSSRFVMDMDVDVHGESVTVHGEGVASGDGKTAQVTITMPMLGTLEERIVDGTVYMDLGALQLPTSSELDGKQWVKVSLDDLQAHGGGDLSALADQSQTGPQQGLEYLRGLSGDVQDLGPDTVAGQPATHYRASIDYAKVAEKLPEGATRDKVAALGTVPADVWIDAQDRVVKMHLTIDGSALGGTGGTAEMTMEISDFGVPVDVQAPRPEDTVDLFSGSGVTI